MEHYFVLNCRTKISESSVRKKVFSLHGLHGLQSAWSEGRKARDKPEDVSAGLMSEQLRTSFAVTKPRDETDFYLLIS